MNFTIKSAAFGAFGFFVYLFIGFALVIYLWNAPRPHRVSKILSVIILVPFFSSVIYALTMVTSFGTYLSSPITDDDMKVISADSCLRDLSSQFLNLSHENFISGSKYEDLKRECSESKQYRDNLIKTISINAEQKQKLQDQ